MGKEMRIYILNNYKNMINNDNYFDDHTYISNSSLCDFVRYNKFWDRVLTPDSYMVKHMIENPIKFEPTDAMIVWTIVDDYFSKWPQELEKYTPVSRRTGKVDNEITMSMHEQVMKMINLGNNFKRFKTFIDDKDTQKQAILMSEIEILNSNTWELEKVKVKGKPDFINNEKKIIVDLKTTASVDMISESLSYKWVAKLTARYIRQLSIYNKLAGGDYKTYLAILDGDDLLWVEIPEKVLKDAWVLIEKDLLDLKHFLDNPEDYPADNLFIPQEEEEEIIL